MDDNVEPKESGKSLDGSKDGGDSIQILDVNVDKKDIVVPNVGMKFGNVEEIYEFHRSYAVKTGFGCKIRSLKEDEGILRHVTYTCVREGKHKPVSNTSFELDPTTKCECKSKITTCLDLDDKWKITVFVSEHTHRTSPNKTRFMGCNKLIKKNVKRKILINYRAGVKMDKNLNIQAVEAGGQEHLINADKYLRNMITREI
ncbi:protein FAR-RED IMPAIRED RESPONSE 1-like [Papaver somniferum]|uniref:protein FAR-RED IMPAIRED RESPONSE 1-like n=1 Tax=Papaver somniferum TaxID=3469 RepID=UPI000E6F804F|nr:protein FAR-RED IMPAIRED RESPONSE 1-like [Papaver somniferum]